MIRKTFKKIPTSEWIGLFFLIFLVIGLVICSLPDSFPYKFQLVLGHMLITLIIGIIGVCLSLR